jgi:two-component system chemotaxis sensor kinase CheA
VTNPLLAQFVSEAADLLAEVDEGLLRLEHDPADADLINAVFRAAHTFKGSSGLFDLPELTRLTHAAEDLLDAVRAGTVPLDGNMVDALLAAFDAVRGWMPVIDASGRVPAGAAAVATELAGRLRAPLGGGAPDGGASASSPSSPSVSSSASSSGAPRRLPDWVGRLPEPALRELATWLTITDTSVRVFDYRPDDACFFRGEDPVQLVRQVPALDLLEITGPESWASLEEFDEYACLLRFTAVTRAAPGEIAHVFRYVPDQVEVVEVTGDALTRLLDGDVDEEPDELAGAADGTVADDRPPALLALLADQRVLLAGAEPGSSVLRSGVEAALRAAAALGARSAPPSPAVVVSEGDTTAFVTWIDDVLGARAEPAAVHGAEGAVGAAAAPPTEAAGAERPDARHDDPGTGSRVLKVEQAKVDRLLDLVGELVVAKNALPFVAAEADDGGQRALARRIRDEYAVVSRVSEELQQAVMDVRMLPVSTAFARAPRLVRDLSRKLGKQVRLVQEGEETAADKDVIETLAEPLVHLVRNSLDHGIETPEERTAAGKPAEATLSLRAQPEGDAVVIEVSDDGRGIDVEAVKRKAYERGLIDESALEAMSDAAAAELVFAPGFSTAAQISDVSGRGVGMDAVRSSIERLGGAVLVDSRAGEGLTVRLRLPLTMAVSRVLLITVGGQRFGVPIDDVVETVRVPPSSLSRVADRPVLALREEVVPVAELTDLLDLPATERAGDRNLLVVRTATGPLALVVDQFDRNTDVILKPLEGFLAGTAGFCGTALLGDGLVLLVLDVKEMNDRAAAAR